MSARRTTTALAVLVALLAPSGALAAPAPAPAPHWTIVSFAAPTYFKPGDPDDYYTLLARNSGAAVTDGSAITVTDTLPAGVTVNAVEGKAEGLENAPLGVLGCHANKPSGQEGHETISCAYETASSGAPVVEPDETLWVRVAVSVGAGAQTCSSCHAEVSGGGAPTASAPDPAVISTQPVPFGLSRFGAEIVSADGEADRQAGSHPYEMTTSFALDIAALDTEPRSETEGLYHDSPTLAASARDLEVELPAGLVGDPNAVPRCSQSVFQSDSGIRCPADTQVGIITFDTADQAVEGAPNEDATTAAVYDVQAPEGQPAELGFQLNTVKVHIFFHVRNGGEQAYGLTAQTPEITQLKPLLLANLTIWGVPADPSHDHERSGALRPGGGNECVRSVEVKRYEEETHALQEEIRAKEAEVEAKEAQVEEAESKHQAKRVKQLEGELRTLQGEQAEDKLSLAELERSGPATAEGCASDVPAKPFLRLPTSCHEGPLPLPALADSWAEPGAFAKATPEPTLEGPSECEGLSFQPSLSVSPERSEPTTPSGYTVVLRVPQDEEPGALATSDLKSSTVALPAGTVASPSAADGLQACSAPAFARTSQTPAACPPASQIGTVAIRSPLLPSPGVIEGQLFLGEPQCTGAGGACTPEDASSGRMIRLLLQAQGFGVTVKLEGDTALDQSTGQLMTTFANDPQLPFEELTLTIHGGARAPLANPSSCGAYTTTSSLEPWSAPHTPTATPSDTFQIGGCMAPRFAPSFEAGPVNPQAGVFSPFTLSFSRSDQDQTLRALTVHLPPGLIGMLSTVVPCPQAQAQTGECGPQSQIGVSTVASGPGPSPFYLSGRVYLTGPYDGAPFGLSIVVPVHAGPFDLGNVVVRSAITVDPYTSAVTVVSDPLPSVVDGVPTQIKAVDVDIDRQRFMYNPTDCAPQGIQGTLTSTAGASAPVSWPVETANCANLPFHPTFEAQTEGRTSKADGASLRVKVTSAGLGQADIAKTVVSLPVLLPSRDSTLQKACLVSVFEADPAGCPAPSDVGTATVHTPVFSKPLTGPAYLVSHGAAELPHLDLVLQGEGVTIILDGSTHIKKGITTESFQALPDAPFTSFETDLPEGPYSALAPYAPTTDLCALPKVAKTVTEDMPLRSHGRVLTVLKRVKRLVPGSLLMPTSITGQNGAVIEQDTVMKVVGCEGVKAARAHKAPRTARRRLKPHRKAA